jgi:hypothetical protein
VSVLDVAAEVAAVVDGEDLAQLAERARVSYECVGCGRAATLADGPAAVVVLRDGVRSVARVAHAACRSSQVVDLPLGGLRVTENAPAVAVASVLPHAHGARPVLVVELGAAVSLREGGDRVDGIATGLMREGLHLVGSPLSMTQRGSRSSGNLQHRIGGLPIDGVVVLAAEQIVVDTRRRGNRGVNAVRGERGCHVSLSSFSSDQRRR